MKKILILANHFITIYAYRRELIEELIQRDYKVYLSIPKSEENTYFERMGCYIINSPIDRRGTNPIADIKLLFNYIQIMKEIEPDVVLTYTIKPNIYGGIASRVCKRKIIHTVTGLGSVFIQDMWQKKAIVFLNRIAFKQASLVFFLNDDNRKLYKKLKIIHNNQKTTLIPGSGVNLEKFQFSEFPVRNTIVFTFIGRILKDKGIEEYLRAAKKIVSRYNNVKFEVVGFVDENKYVSMLKEYQEKKIIHYLGQRNDIFNIIQKSSCVVLPSYGEGRGTVLQEGAAVGRPLISCDTYGCRDNIEDGFNGYLCKVADSSSLVITLEKFINLSDDERVLMGKRSHEKAVKEFDRKTVIDSYLKELDKNI